MTEWIPIKRVWKFFLIIFVGTAFAILLHQAVPDPLMTLSTKPKSIVPRSRYSPKLHRVRSNEYSFTLSSLELQPPKLLPQLS